MKKILSMFLAVVLLAGVFCIEASAALKPVYAVDENNKATDVIDYKATVNQYLDSANVFTTDEEKLAMETASVTDITKYRPVFVIGAAVILCVTAVNVILTVGGKKKA